MNAADSMTTGVDQTFLLMGYSNREIFWRVDRLRDGSIRVSSLEERPADALTGGILESWKLAGGEAVPMAFFSQRLYGELGIPNFAENLVLLINGKLMGDGIAVPEISFRRGVFSNDFSVRLKDGLVFQAHYSRPLLREAWWSFIQGGALDYYPVDFIELLVDIVARNRPHWLVDDQS